MIYYHMSDTLQLGGTLALDYKRQKDLAMPFAQALNRSEDCFFAMYLNGKYLREVLGKFSLRDMWSDYVKWSCEGIFEYIRQTEYPDSVCRMACNYFYDNLEDIRKLYTEDWGRAPEEERNAIRLYEITLDDPAPQKRDMLWFDRAYDALWDNDDLPAALDCARSYFAGKGTDHPVWEILSDKPGIASKDLSDWLHATE